MSGDLLLPYQRRWIDERAQFAVIEKCRRAGVSWATAGDDALYAAQRTGGGNVWYMGQDKDMSQAYITDVAWWAQDVYQLAAADLREEVLEDGENGVLAYTVKFDSGNKITALSSRPANLRSKGRPGDRFTFDEAAFHPDFEGLLKAAVALLMWGCRIRIISTHNGEDNPFNELIQDIRAGRRDGAVQRVEFRQAIRDGLFKRICQVNGQAWTAEDEVEFVQAMYKQYRDNAAEELDVVPASGSGVWLPRALIEQRMVEADVFEVAA